VRCDQDDVGDSAERMIVVVDVVVLDSHTLHERGKGYGLFGIASLRHCWPMSELVLPRCIQPRTNPNRSSATIHSHYNVRPTQLPNYSLILRYNIPISQILHHQVFLLFGGSANQRITTNLDANTSAQVRYRKLLK